MALAKKAYVFGQISLAKTQLVRELLGDESMHSFGVALPDELGKDRVANCLCFDGLSNFLSVVSRIKAT